MWGSKKTASVSGGTTLISHETVVIGEVHFSGNLDVEGLVQGNIIAQSGKDALLRVVGKGRVEGDIRVPYAIINGAVQGNVYSTKLSNWHRKVGFMVTSTILRSRWRLGLKSMAASPGWRMLMQSQ